MATAAAALAVAGDEGAGPDEAEDLLAALVSQSLLVLTEQPAPVGMQYSMLATVREFAGHEPAAAGETAAVERRLAGWARSYARSIDPDLLEVDQVRAFRQLEAAQDSLVAGMRWAVEHADRQLAPEIFASLSFYWAMSGAHAEVITWAGRILPLTGLDLPPGAAGSDRIGAHADHDSLAICYQLICMHMMFVADWRAGMLALHRLRMLLRLSTTLSAPNRQLCELLLNVVTPQRGASALRAALSSPHQPVRDTAALLLAGALENAGRFRAARRSAQRLYASMAGRSPSWVRASASRLVASIDAGSADYESAIRWLARSMADMGELHAQHERFEASVRLAICLAGVGRVSQARAALLGPRPGSPGD